MSGDGLISGRLPPSLLAAFRASTDRQGISVPMPIFYAFDLLWLNGRDLRQLPLLERKRMLRSLVKPANKNRILFADHILGWGIDFFRTVCEQNRVRSPAFRIRALADSRGLLSFI